MFSKILRRGLGQKLLPQIKNHVTVLRLNERYRLTKGKETSTTTNRVTVMKPVTSKLPLKMIYRDGQGVRY